MEKEKEKPPFPHGLRWPRITTQDFITYMIIGALCLVLLAVTHEAAGHIEELHDYYQGEMTRLGCRYGNTIGSSPINTTTLEKGYIWKP